MNDENNKIILAARFANDAHRGQVRKYTSTPYILHPMRVAGRVSLIEGATEAMVCAAWLHDVIEDCNITVSQVSVVFGDTVAMLVFALTNSSKLTMPDASRQKRKEADRDCLRHVSAEAQTIKLADRIDNLLEMDGAPDDFIALYRRESRDLLNVLSRGDPRLRDELAALTAPDRPAESSLPIDPGQLPLNASRDLEVIGWWTRVHELTVDDLKGLLWFDMIYAPGCSGGSQRVDKFRAGWAAADAEIRAQSRQNAIEGLVRCLVEAGPAATPLPNVPKPPIIPPARSADG